MALQLAQELNPQNIYIIGYDGYKGNSMEQKEQELLFENDSLFKEVNEKVGLNLASLSPTNYKNLEVISIYSLLA